MTPTNDVSNFLYDANCEHSILKLHVLLRKFFLLEATTLIFLFGKYYIPKILLGAQKNCN